jgi:hypothetical protein
VRFRIISTARCDDDSRDYSEAPGYSTPTSLPLVTSSFARV